MRKIIYSTILLAFSAMQSCQNSGIDESPTLQAITNKITVSAHIDTSVTRVALTPNNEGDWSRMSISTEWDNVGETFAVVRGSEKQIFAQTSDSTDDISTFEGTLPTNGEGNYYAYYPATTVDNTGVATFDLSEQTGKLDETKSFMVASSTNGSQYYFEQTTAILGISFKKNSSENITSASSIIITLPEGVTADYTYTAGELSAGTKSTIDITPTDVSDGKFYIYLPAGIKNGDTLSILVQADGYYYPYTLTASKDIETGMFYYATNPVALDSFTANSAITYTAPTKATLLGYHSAEHPRFGTEGEDYNHYFIDGVGYIVKIGGTWTSVPASAFEDCAEITTITLPQAVTIVEHNAFAACDNLIEISMPGVTTIAECHKLSNQPGGIKQWGVFEQLDALERVYAPAVKYIGAYAFYTCKKLKEVILPTTGDGITINNAAFNTCTNLSDINLCNVISVDSNAFANCTSLTSCNLSSAKTIGNGAFHGCTNLEVVDISNVSDITDGSTTIYGIGAQAFSNCSKLGTVILPSGNDYQGDGYSIGSSAFQQTKITSLDLSKMKMIDQAAFFNITSLKDITAMPERSFTLGANAFYECKSLQSIDLKNATAIGKQCFYNCQNLIVTDLTNIKELGGKAFYQCPSLGEINLPNVITIGENCFQYSNITSVTLGQYIKSIATRAFNGCVNLETVKIEATTPPELTGSYPESCFTGPGDMIIYVPESAVSTYKSDDYWQHYADKIQPISTQ